jgi:hypothetical protein
MSHNVSRACNLFSSCTAKLVVRDNYRENTRSAKLLCNQPSAKACRVMLVVVKTGTDVATPMDLGFVKGLLGETP